MTPEQFCYWLQGYFEITDAYDSDLSLLPKQLCIIKEHLGKVFNNEPTVTINGPWPAPEYPNGEYVPPSDFSSVPKLNPEDYNVVFEHMVSC